jgi:hypothetical protein
VSTCPYALAGRFVYFASRVHEVREVPDCVELSLALGEILGAVLHLTTGRAVDILPASTAAKIAGIVTALVEHGPFTAPEDLAILEALHVSVDELFKGLAACSKPRLLSSPYILPPVGYDRLEPRSVSSVVGLLGVSVPAYGQTVSSNPPSS